MAIIGNLSFPAVTTIGDISSAVVAQRFPVPISVTAALMDVENDNLPIDDPEYFKLASPYTMMAVLQPEGSHMEPTIGQIWPR